MKAELFDLFLPYPEKGDRRVRVYVPEHKEGETFPVIYMTDGQNLFDEETGTWGCWFTREAVEAERKLSGKAADAEKIGVELAEKLLAAGGQEILQELGLLQNK